MIKYMSSGPVVAMVWQGKDVVKQVCISRTDCICLLTAFQGRVLLGATNPLASAPGTIRGDYCIDVGRNICHGSDSVETAKREIALWFGEQDSTISYTRAVDQWVYEKACRGAMDVCASLRGEQSWSPPCTGRAGHAKLARLVASQAIVG